MTKAIAIKVTCLKTGAISNFRSVTEAADLGGFSQACITRCIRGIADSHAGHKFESEGGKRGTPRSRARTVKVKELRAKGHTIENIAALLGIAMATVHYHIKVQLADQGVKS